MWPLKSLHPATQLSPDPSSAAWVGMCGKAHPRKRTRVFLRTSMHSERVSGRSGVYVDGLKLTLQCGSSRTGTGSLSVDGSVETVIRGLGVLRQKTFVAGEIPSRAFGS